MLFNSLASAVFLFVCFPALLVRGANSALQDGSLLYASYLHGLICADAYGIPSMQIELGHGVVGEAFKFRDYYSPLNLQPTKPIRPALLDDPGSIAQECTLKKMDLDLDLLLGSCPFRQPR